MKHLEGLIPTPTHKRPLSLWDFARFAAFLTFGMTVAILVTAAIQGNPYVWAVTAILCPVTILLVWIVTLTIGCLVMIPVGIWRLSKRLARQGAEKTIFQGPLWDQWIDGPEPLRP
jgi:uncharacterized protein (DUF2062 family)